MKKYKIEVNLNELKVYAIKAPPTIAGSTSRNHVKVSLGLIPDQIRTTKKTMIQRILILDSLSINKHVDYD